jgi:hypothetical protein
MLVIKGAQRKVNAAVSEYKQILQTVLDNRPSGTRQRLAEALETNKSFVSQITNPAYHTPIPAQHLPIIFQVCHFSPIEKQEFEKAYSRAHPRRLTIVRNKPASRVMTLTVPDFGDARKNREFEEMVTQFVKRIAQFSQDSSE